MFCYISIYPLNRTVTVLNKFLLNLSKLTQIFNILNSASSYFLANRILWHNIAIHSKPREEESVLNIFPFQRQNKFSTP